MQAGSVEKIGAIRASAAMEAVPRSLTHQDAPRTQQTLSDPVPPERPPDVAMSSASSRFSGGSPAPTARSTPVPDELGQELSRAAAGVVERVLAHLCGRVYSPRIRLLDMDQLSDAMGLAPSTVYQLVAGGQFPKPIKIGRQNKWRESTLIAWLDRREEAIQNAKERR